jgi:DnaJ-domain-containing protein 1
VSFFDRVKEAGRRAAQASETAGRAAVEAALKNEDVKRRVETAKQIYAEAREVFDERFREVEADLWERINALRAEAEKAHRQAKRAQDADHHYRTLGVERGATPGEIKAAWRRQMRACHPDKFANDPAAESRAHARSQEVNRAYQELSALLTGREDRRAD